MKGRVEGDQAKEDGYYLLINIFIRAKCSFNQKVPLHNLLKNYSFIVLIIACKLFFNFPQNYFDRH